jgi:hypothetical protein
MGGGAGRAAVGSELLVGARYPACERRAARASCCDVMRYAGWRLGGASVCGHLGAGVGCGLVERVGTPGGGVVMASTRASLRRNLNGW